MTHSQKPIFVATHPRACSTAFERVFMTQRDKLQCIHEPFGDAFYYGPERLSSRYSKDEKSRQASGFADSTYQTILDRFENESAEGKRLFIKDMAYYLVPEGGIPASVAPSLHKLRKGVGTADSDSTNHKSENPTVLPDEVLRSFQWAFLIRHPNKGIPSFWRCCMPPLSQETGWDHMMPEEAGYTELRRLFEYLRKLGQVGPSVATHPEKHVNGVEKQDGDHVEICIVDADDLLDYPAETIEKFCKSVGLDYNYPSMLKWNEEDQEEAAEKFAKWHGFHHDAIQSSELRPRAQKHEVKSIDEEMPDWVKKYGGNDANKIKAIAEANLKDYEYLRQYAIKVGEQ